MPWATLTTDETKTALAGLDGWAMVDGRNAIRRTIRFSDFPKAMAFMAQAVPVIEDMNHHPEWSNTYNRVTILLTTHDNGAGESGVTRLDIELATALDRLADPSAAPSG